MKSKANSKKRKAAAKDKTIHQVEKVLRVESLKSSQEARRAFLNQEIPATVPLDVIEQEENEIEFQQVAGR